MPVYALEVASTSFSQAGKIADRYTCSGANVSPQLSWKDVPAGTKSFVIICEDTDAPMSAWVHWIIFNIPAATRDLPAGASPGNGFSDGTLEGVNDFGGNGYGGPCPPPGKSHRYVFHVYALDTKLTAYTGVLTKDDLHQAMRGHLLGQASTSGTYERS
ncbi:MAG: YbhB/YbcL family Raf kinase inhibitor-like protein [Candidatus Omnitrophica bacterium]|nr:YbhB/YbcL family Raf kinase inhibitor-like protein [Candidatus Omnitrophota bacterium]